MFIKPAVYRQYFDLQQEHDYLYMYRAICLTVKGPTLQLLYNTMVHYNTVLDITPIKDGSPKCIDYIEK